MAPNSITYGKLIWPLESIVDRLEWSRLFPAPNPVEVELGSGDGSFILDYASAHPERNFLAVERLLGRLRKVDRKGTRMGLKNLRAVRIEASYLLEFLLPLKSVSALHLYFPDPWPKRRHSKYRLVNEVFPRLCERVLIPGGHVYLRTDNTDYFAQMLEMFAAAPHFKKVETPASLSRFVTDFEKYFNAQGIETNKATYRTLNIEH